MRDWYSTAPAAPQVGRLVTMRDILAHWNLVELDLQDQGIDVESGILSERTWRWLKLRLSALVTRPGGRIQRQLNP